MAMIEVQGLSKSYGDFPALQDVSFSIQKDHGITALLGPNGAGKTTTMRLLTGYLEPTAGSIRIDGRDLADEQQRLEMKRNIGYLPETTPLYPEMLVSEFLEFSGRVRGLSGEALEARARDMIEKLELGSHLYSPIGILSKGFRQRVALAGTLIHEPGVIILDEPTSGLDPNQISHIRMLIKSLSRTATLILSTHILQEVEDICDRVIIVSRGRIVADAPTTELRSLPSVRIVARGASSEAVASKLKDSNLVRSCRPDAGTATVPEGFTAIICELSGERPEELFKYVASQGWDVREFAPLKRSLQEIFGELTAN